MASSLPGDDEAIRRRLFNEGDSGADDRRINILIRNFIRWTEMTPSEESDQMYERLFSTLAQCQYSLEKTQLIYEMNLLEQENYENLSTEIEEAISLSKCNIVDAKKELQCARMIRRNRQEYDILAKVIQQHPDRKATEEKINELNQELEELNETRKVLNEKLELRKKQLTALVTVIHEMQKTLEVEEDNVKNSIEDGEMDVS